MSSPNQPRKFKVEHIETITRHSREQGEVKEKEIQDQGIQNSTIQDGGQPFGDNSKSKKTARKFVPQLVETSSRYRGSNESPSTTSTSAAFPSESPVKRKFTPQLVETSSRSRREEDSTEDSSPTVPHSHQPQVGSFTFGSQSENTISRSIPWPITVPSQSQSPPISTLEARRLGIPLPIRKISQSSIRSHSYKTTELETIESSESEESSPSNSASDLSYCHATRVRESVDDSTSGYLLELAAKAAEKQLQEQALAAFPNDDRHLPIRHYADLESMSVSRSDSRNDMEIYRNNSADMELKALRKHAMSNISHGHVKDKGNKDHRKRAMDGNAWSYPSNTATGLPHKTQKECNDYKQNSNPLEKMRDKARPPMLGSDILFPRCGSPDGARFDVTQGSERLRQQMCYLTAQSESSGKPCGGLWSPKKSQTGQCSMWSRTSSRAPSQGGLWGGSCMESTNQPPKGPTGILTPKLEEDMPMEGVLHTSPALGHLPPSPPPSNSGMASLDEKLEIEEIIENEFNDVFVTQVYNYLSLGYPSLAHSFDEELSKISRISISELREDDHLPCSRGYIRLGEDETNEGIEEESCARWRALRLYIQEWARQQPKMIPATPQGGGMIAARKGSWAW